MKTLNDQYQQIKKGKGHKGMFLTEAKRQFPNYVRTAASFHEAETILKQRGVINEGIVSLEPINNPFSTSKKESYEVAFEAFLSEAKKKENEDEKVKAIEKKPSKKVKEDADKNFDNTDEKTPDNMIFDQIMMGYYAEMKDPKNSEKTMQELKDIVFKNLAKDSIHYTKEGQFGVKDLGYSVDHPGLGEPKEAKGKYKASGYGDLNENQQPVNESESKLRKVIREMIDEELEEVSYQMYNTVPKKIPFEPKGEPKETSQYINIPDGIMKTLIERGYIIIEEGGVFVSGTFIANVDKLLKYDKNTKEKTFFSNKSVYSPDKETKTNIYTGVKDPSYRKIIAPDGVTIKSTKLPEFRTNDEGNTKVVPPVDSKLLFQAIVAPDRWRTFTTKSKDAMESLMESVEKDLDQINKEAEREIISSKLEKVQALIDKKQAQISKLDEDEDMKALTDDKKVKEIQKDIKALEKAKVKLEKLAGKVKGKTKEVIDEMDGMNEDSEQMYLDKAMELYDKEYAKPRKEDEEIDIDALVSTNFPSPEYDEDIRLDIKDYLEGYSPDMDSDY
jgi:hypothetical protein